MLMRLPGTYEATYSILVTRVRWARWANTLAMMVTFVQGLRERIRKRYTIL